MADTIIITYRYRVKDKHAKALNRMANSVNSVWNYCNDAQKHAVMWGRQWPTGFDLNKATAGSNKDLGLHSGTVNEVCEQYAKSRRQRRRPYLRYRNKKSLGWVPFKGRSLRQGSTGFRFYGVDYCVWLSRPLPENADITDGGSFSRDSLGRWYLNIPVRIAVEPPRQIACAVGIDLGLKSFATLSTGETVEAPRFFRKAEARLAIAQRARQKRIAKRIQSKIANQRRDYLHKASTSIVRRHDAIYAGDVKASRLAKTKMAKSVLDAGWSSFRKMLAYKSVANGATYREVNEAYSTQTCSVCGSRSGPQGRKCLVIREWRCSGCGSIHNRDHNAACVILRYGHVSP